MKYKRNMATGIIAFSLLAGGVSAFAADVTASTTKLNHYNGQVKMKSSIKNSKLDSNNVSTSTKKVTKKVNRVKSRNTTKTHPVVGTVDAKDASGKDIETKDDAVKKVSTNKQKKVNTVHKNTTGKVPPVSSI